MMADDLEKFIEDQKAKLAQDKAELENDPPYMEMRNKESEKLSETSKMLISMAKENIPPNSQQNYPLGDYGLSLPLGEEYERKKHKLKEELRQDYRRYLSQKNYLTTDEVDPYTQGLSLPIDERRSAKERLRLERNKEYNQYLRDKEEWNERLRRLGKKNRENEMHRNKTPIAVTRLQPELHAEVQPCNPGAEPPKKDAFTSTERCEELLNKRWMEEDRYHRKHHRIDEDGDFGRRYYRVDYDPETNAEMDPRFRSESTYGRKTPRVFYAERPYLNGMVRDVPADYEDELKERARVRPLSRTGDSRNQIQISSSTSEQVKSAGERRYATGLVLGGQDRELLQRRKEKYRQELMEQMAEQQRNKRREKELELSVAASGVQDPEKQPDRLKQFGFTARAFEEKVPPERPRVAFQTPMPARSASPVNEDSQSDKDFQRGLVSSLGEMLAPRLAPLPPPPPPVLTDNYKTPYDDAYYFYGARNPLDPALAYYGTGMMGMQPTSSLDPPLGQAPVEQPVSNIGERNTGDRQRSIGMYSEEKTKPSKEATLSYQQELQQQIREREERRRQEREEKEKLEAEMKNYNPWGKGGGGAPLKDAEGNLITDLNVMHKRNEEAYHNPEPRPNEDKRAIVDLNLASSRPENSEASTNKIAGITFAQASPFARGNVFAEPPSPEQLKRQESYKNFLRLQIEEKRRREEAEREKLRIEEEKEEKRLAEQRMRIQKAYEEELEERRRKDEERRLKNKEVIQLGEERRKEAEKRQKEKEEKQEEQLRQYFEKEKMEEEKKTLSRQSSPVIPALQNKSARKEERIPSAESRLSYYAQDPPQPRAPSPPVPARRNQLRSLEERKNVINELSEMRKQLRSEERRLQEQLLNVASHDNVPITRRRREKNPRDIFEMARLRLQAPVRRPSLKEAQDPVNIQNIWEFNELKYKDPETRMVLRHMYPDPPKDDQTLEIQQQALLREQQRKLDKMRMRRETEVFDDQEDSALDNYPQTMGLFRNKSNEFQKNSLLESDSAFIGANGEMFSALEEVNLLPQHPLSARERRRLKQRALESAVHEEVPAGQTPLPQPDSFSLHSNFSLDVEQVKGKNEERLHRLTELQQNSPSLGDDISLGDVDDLLKRAQSQASSTDTVATEPWLRPGTSATLRRLLAEQPGAGQLSPGSAGQLSPGSAGKLSQQSALPMAWHGLSTAHG
ncbi:centrosome and spindle pole-associated protein 1 isoform X5 [Camarhynchus parvulus]|uniref:centrosome and spindle pole-associated protein 1 isoform X5 n=1 Tax=Geospiza parvula TaxID=87175 RepID=UPI001237AADB|nr:centrosome and spindle pole-associated protein 1 isoform X5 [Camarhynchus parvulus]